MQTRKITSPASLTFLLSSLASIGIHYYLTNQHINLKYGLGETSAICNISDKFSCDTAIISSYSEVFGIPLSIFGMFLNMVILFYGVKALLFAEPKNNASTTLTFTVLSAVGSVIMALISVAVLKSLCPFCTMAYVLSFVMLAAGLKIFKPLITDWNGFIKPFAIASVFVLVGSFVYSKMVLQDFNSKEVRELLALQMSEWEKAPATPPEVTEPLKYGPDLAKMKIVEYADFLCPHCRVAYNKLHTFAKTHPQAQVIFQPFPLDGCSGTPENPGLRCQLAMAAHCSAKQNKGWEAHEYLFHHQEQIASHGSITETVAQLSAATQINKEQLEACVKDVATLEVIKKQLEGGKKLGIEGTPSIYINDKKFRGAMHLPLLTDIYNKL